MKGSLLKSEKKAVKNEKDSRIENIKQQRINKENKKWKKYTNLESNLR